MRKHLIIMAAALILPFFASAGDANLQNYLQVYGPNETLNATGTVVSAATYHGNGRFLASVDTSTATNYTATITLQTSATTNGTFATVTNLAGTVVQASISGAASASLNGVQIDIERLNKFVRVVVAQANETNAVSAVLVAPFKSQ
jgi:hypothetical protein